SLPITIYQPDRDQIPYLQENDINWAGPILLFTVAALSENPHLVSVALGVVSNYVTAIFKGSAEPVRAKLSVVIETATTKTTTKTTKRYDFDGPPEDIPSIISLIKDSQK